MDSIRISKVQNVVCIRRGATDLGTLHVTAHHLIFCPNKSQQQGGGESKSERNDGEVWIPYPLINLVTQLPLTIQGHAPLSVQTRIFTSYLFRFSNDSEALDVFESVKNLTVVTAITQLYAFFYSPVPPPPHFPHTDSQSGWRIYNPREEFARMGVGSRTRGWRLTDLNKNYNLTPTYPALLCVPTRISDSTLTYGAKYRSKGRIPALSYLHWNNLGTITRCSQPMIGLTNNRSIQDEKLVEAIFTSHHVANTRMPVTGNEQASHNQKSQPVIYGSTPSCLIIDARPTANAFANAAKGGGTENMDYYKDGKKAYVGLENIHVMRDSLSKICAVIREGELLEESGGGVGATFEVGSGGGWIDRSGLRRSGWLRHIASQLEGARLIAKTIHVQASHVLIHCSDGWDRTSQLSALTQVCLDPYYRTIRGFAVLIEKDWVSFGYMFGDRCGHLSSDKIFLSPPVVSGGGAEFLANVQTKLAGGQNHLKETAPIFHQFLEATWNVLQQYPERFEFNAEFLQEIFYHVYSCQFGTFLFNCERERMESLSSPQGAQLVSIWDYLLSDERKSKFINDSYNPALDDCNHKQENGRYGDMGVLLPDPKATKFWASLYGREDAEMNSRPGQLNKSAAPDIEVVHVVEGEGDNPVLSIGTLKPDNPRLGLQRPVSTPPVSPNHLGSQNTTGGSTQVSDTLSHSVLDAFAVSTKTSPSSSPVRKPMDQLPLHRKEQSFRPETESVFTMRTQNRADSSRITTSPTTSAESTPRNESSSPQSFDNRMKSMWGRFSSNASAALSAVQDAYEGVANEFRGLNIQDHPSRGNDRELSSPVSTSTNTRFSDVSGSTSPSQHSTLPRSTMRSPTGQSGLLPEDNPWVTTAQRRVQRAKLNPSTFNLQETGERSVNIGSYYEPSRANSAARQPRNELPYDPTISHSNNPWSSETSTIHTHHSGPSPKLQPKDHQPQSEGGDSNPSFDPLGVGGP